MRKIVEVVIIAAVCVVFGCKQSDPRIHVRSGVGSDTLGSNIVTRPVVRAFSALIGEGIVVDEALTRTNETGFMELNVNGHNKAYDTKKFRYKVEWFDADGFLISSKTNVWMQASAMGKSPFSIKATAPSVDAVTFKMDTRKWE
ncbi:MAG: YcfL family protein [Phycisphaerae bacterium]|nr:YcfL family protein [Phycisphaerae bacterium]